MLITVPTTLTDGDLIARIAAFNGVERTATAFLIAHLAELEARNLHLAQGFRSLFGYCRHVLHCSEHEAYNRMEAVHAARRFPVILGLLAEGRLHLTAVRLLAPHLKDEDHLALLGGAIHKSKREILELLARWFPSPDVASSIRRLPPAPGAVPAAERAALVRRPEAAGESTEAVPPSSASAAVPQRQETPSGAETSRPVAGSVARRPVLAPLSAHSYRLEVTIQDAAHDDLRCLQDLMRRDIPTGDPAAIVARALRLLREEAQKRAFSATARPRSGRAAKPGSRDIPAHVERAVWRHDEGQCSFEGPRARCSERSFLEFHHVRPWAAGGPPTPENIALRCRVHNAYEAALYFGPIRAAMAARDADSFPNETGNSRPRGPTGQAA